MAGNSCRGFGIFHDFPPGGQHIKLVLTPPLFRDSISAKKLLRRREQKVLNKVDNLKLKPTRYTLTIKKF